MRGHNTMGTTPIDLFASWPQVNQVATALLMQGLHRRITEDDRVVQALDGIVGPQPLVLRVHLTGPPSAQETWYCRLLELDDHGQVALWLESDRISDGSYIVCRLTTFGRWTTVQSVAVTAAFDIRNPLDRADALEALAPPVEQRGRPDDR